MTGLCPERIGTERLRLAPQLPEHVGALEAYDICASDPGIDEVTRYVPWEPHETPTETLAFLRRGAERRESGEVADYVIRPREGEEGAGEIASFCGLNVEWQKRSAELGIWLRKRFWGRGYSGERAVALVEFAFDRLGGRRDGTFRNYLANHDGTPCDQTCYSISRRRNFRRNAQPCEARNSSMVRRRTIEVSGMSCDGCERAVQNALKNVTGVRRAEADHGAGTVEVVAEDDATDDDLGDAVRTAGYEVVA